MPSDAKTKPQDAKSPKKESKGTTFLRVMRHPVDAIEGAVDESRSKKQIKKDAEAQYKIAYEGIADWYKQGNDKLNWLVGEFSQFEAKILDAKAAKKDSKRGIGVATDLLIEAKEIGQDAQLATTQRASIQASLQTVIGLTSPANTPQKREASVTANSIREALGKPDANLAELRKQAEGLAAGLSDVGGGEQVAKKRLELKLKLQETIRTAAGEIGLALNELYGSKGSGAVSSTHVVDELQARTKTSAARLDPQSDDPGWADTAARLTGLDAHYNQAASEIAKTIADYRKEMKKDAGKALYDKAAKQQEGYLDANKKEAAKNEFEAAYQPLATALSLMLDQGTPEGAALAKRIAAEKAQVIASNWYGISDRWIETALAEVKQETAGAISSMAAEATALNTAVDTLLQDLKKQKKAADLLAKPYEVLFTEAEQIRPLIKTSNAGALVSARQLIDEIRTAALGSAIADVTAFIAAAAHIKEVAETKAVTKEFATEAQSLTKALDTVVKAVDLHDLAKSSFALAGLTKQADEMTQKTEALERWRRSAKAQLDLLKKSIDSIEDAVGGKKGVLQQVRDAIGTSDIYGKTVFGQDYKTVHDAYEKPGVDSAAMQTLLFAAQASASEILKKIKDGDKAGGIDDIEASKGAATSRAEEAQAKQDEVAAENARITTMYNDLVATLRETRTLVKDHSYGDKDELDEIEELRNQVKKKIAKKDFAGAKEQLEGGNGGLVARLTKLHDAPGGVTADSIDKLKDINSLWQTAQKNVGASLNTITTQAEPIAERLAIDKTAIGKRVAELRAKLFGFDFFEPVRVLIDDKRDIKARKVAREDALKLVRDARAVLMANPIAESLRNNPFNAASPFTDYRVFLDSLEYNALRAVPPE